MELACKQFPDHTSFQKINHSKNTVVAQDSIRTVRSFEPEQCNSSFHNFEHSESTEQPNQQEASPERLEKKNPISAHILNLDTTLPSEHFSGNSCLEFFADNDKDSTLSDINENDIEAEELVLANHDRSLLSNGVLECSAIVGASMTDLENEVIRKSLNDSAALGTSDEVSGSKTTETQENCAESSEDIKTFLKKYIECMARSDLTLDGLQNELDRERQHRFNAEIDNRQLKYEANQAYADQTSLNKRMEALEKLIEERVSKASAVSSGGVVPGPVPAAPVVAAVPTVGYPPSGVGNGVVFESPNYGIDLERFKKDIEAQCRMELIEQQQKVNNYLDEQINMRSNFEKVRTEQENALKQEYNRRISDLELEIRKYKDLYGVTIPVRDPGVVVASAMTSLGEDPELKRLHTLLEKERRQREKLESRLDRMVDRDIESRAQIAVEKQRMNDLTSSGGLGSTVGLGNQSGHVSEFDALLEKVRRQLDNSISRHLGTTKMELEMFSQHPYATRDRSFYPTNSDRISNFNPSYKF